MKQQQTQKLTVQQAGAQGGAVTYGKYGSEHFRAIGRKGQASLAGRVTSEQRRAWGTKGGRPKKTKLQNVGEKGEFR